MLCPASRRSGSAEQRSPGRLQEEVPQDGAAHATPTSDMVDEVQQAQHIQLILLWPDAAVQPLGQAEGEVVHIPLQHATALRQHVAAL